MLFVKARWKSSVHEPTYGERRFGDTPAVVHGLGVNESPVTGTPSPQVALAVAELKRGDEALFCQAVPTDVRAAPEKENEARSILPGLGCWTPPT